MGDGTKGFGESWDAFYSTSQSIGNSLVNLRNSKREPARWLCLRDAGLWNCQTISFWGVTSNAVACDVTTARVLPFGRRWMTEQQVERS